MSVYDEKVVMLRDGATVTLRSPTEADAEALVAYLDRVRRETDFLMFDPADDLPTLEAEREWIRGSLNNPLSLKIVAEVAGRPVGLCDVTAGGRLKRARHRGTIGISILAEWCNRGLGTLLMRELVEWSRRQPEITLLRLGVLAHNARAIEVYRRVGFVEEGVCRHAVRYGVGGYGDEVMMSMWIGPDAAPSAGRRDAVEATA